ncbi:LuxR C-terminal-related transcriptional regulator [Algibacter sp. 2305UL17-15]|uniref:LuxR C-terminal-related transcriptional regulator n=1 Tax=Algibacter sp. 2305UL17-15 TaxID=3231268 RepID=UPI0034598A27
MEDLDPDIIEFSNTISQKLKNKEHTKKDFSDLDAFPIIEGKQCLYVIDWHQKKITYARGIEQMLGYEKDEFTPRLIMTYFHPDDVKIVKRIIKVGVSHVTTTKVSKSDMFLTIAFRLIKKDNSYLKVLRHTQTYDVDAKGILISNVSLLTDISFMSANNKVEWDINFGTIDPKKLRERIFKEFLDFFTPRELDVVKLIAKGKTTKQISNQLYISEHTVYSHRKNILKKSNTHNAKELLDFCNKIGVL